MFEVIQPWCKRHDVDCYTNETMIQDDQVRALIWKEIEERIQHLGKWEQPKKMELCSAPWGVDTGELTPTLKLKRKKILEKYADLVDKIYE